MKRFNVGDIIYKDETSVHYTVEDIDVISGPMPKYKLVDGNFKFWDYCIGWKKLVALDDVLRYGEVLTDDIFDLGSDWKNYDVRIRTIRYESHIFYYKMENYKVIEFKELTV